MLKQKQNIHTLKQNDLVETLHPQNIFKNSTKYYNLINDIKEIIKILECKNNKCKEEELIIDNIFFNQTTQNFEVEIYDISENIDSPIFIWEKKYSLVMILEILKR